MGGRPPLTPPGTPPNPSIFPLCPPPHGPSSPPPDPGVLTDLLTSLAPGFPDQPWFQCLLDHPCCPSFIWSICLNSTLIHVDFLPKDIEQLCQVNWHESGSISREYYAIQEDSVILNSPNCKVETHPDVILTIRLEDADLEEESIIFQV